jgi:hypothetical protein
VSETADNELTELLPPVPRADECAVPPFEARVHHLVLIALTVGIDIQPSIPRVVKKRELAMLDERTNTSFTG